MAQAGPLRVAIVPGVNPGKWTKLWAERRPETPIEVLPVPESEQGDVLASGDCDLLFARLPIARVDSEALHLIRLYEEQPVVVAGRDHIVSVVDAVAPEDLSEENVLPGPLEDSVDLIVAGGGVAVVPQSVARQFARKDLVVKPMAQTPATTIALAWLRETGAAVPKGADIAEFIGIVRGRTANSSRG